MSHDPRVICRNHPGRSRTNAVWLAAGGVLCLLLGTLSGVRAEQLPIKAWTTADGLAHNHINRIRRDSRGYLWFCTGEGLSRFDGYQFITSPPRTACPIARSTI